jgi:glyoxylase-like metal-dependent hydrolase (beta-lactamase superfamily II)
MKSISRTQFTRRIAHVAAVVGILSALDPAAVVAQDEGPVEKINAEAAQATISATSIRGGLTVLMGSGGNITVLNGSDGKLLVDAGIAVSRQRIEEALQAVGRGPLRYLIDTHYHWDHTDGNEWVHGRMEVHFFCLSRYRATNCSHWGKQDSQV